MTIVQQLNELERNIVLDKYADSGYSYLSVYSDYTEIPEDSG
jgi:hypothetical protein